MSNNEHEPTDKPNQGVGGIGLVNTILIAFAIAVFVVYAWSRLFPSGHANVVVVDSNRIINTATQRIMSSPNISPEQAASAGADMAKKLQAAIDEYRHRGYVVINSNVVVGFPPELDITKEVADRASVPLE